MDYVDDVLTIRIYKDINCNILLDECRHEIDDTEVAPRFDALDDLDWVVEEIEEAFGGKWSAAVIFNARKQGHCIFREQWFHHKVPAITKPTFISRLYIFDAPDIDIMRRVFSGSLVYELDLHKLDRGNRFIFGRDEYVLEHIGALLLQNHEHFEQVTVVLNASSASLTALRLSENIKRAVWCRSREALLALRDMYLLARTVDELYSAMAPALNELTRRQIPTLNFVIPLDKRVSTLSRKNWLNFQNLFCN